MKSAVLSVLLSLIYTSTSVPFDDISFNCVSVMSEKSGTADDSSVYASCALYPGYTLVSCGVKSLSKNIDGSKIVGDQCKAQNGNGGTGVWAVARCCDLGQKLDCVNRESGFTPGVDDSTVTSTCSSDEQLFGCSVLGYWSNMDGAYPGTRTGHGESITSKCTAQSGYESYGVQAEARCCDVSNLIIDGGGRYGFDCFHSIGWKSSSAIGAESRVTCDGAIMAGCSSHSDWQNLGGWYIEDDECIATNGGEGYGVTAHAICCDYWAVI